MSNSKCYAVLINFIPFDKDSPMEAKLEKYTLKDALAYINTLYPTDIYNIWDTETGELIQGKHPETGEIVKLPTRQALDTGRPM